MANESSAPRCRPTALSIIALALGGGIALIKFGQKQSVVATTDRAVGQKKGKKINQPQLTDSACVCIGA